MASATTYLELLKTLKPTPFHSVGAALWDPLSTSFGTAEGATDG